MSRRHSSRQNAGMDRTASSHLCRYRLQHVSPVMPASRYAAVKIGYVVRVSRFSNGFRRYAIFISHVHACFARANSSRRASMASQRHFEAAAGATPQV